MARFRPMSSADKPSTLSRDFLLLSMLFMLCLAVVALVVTLRTYNEHSSSVIAHLENESLRIDRALIVEIEDTSYLLESMARQIRESGPERLDVTARLLRSFDDPTHRTDMLSWIDPNQMIVASSNRGVLAKPIDISDRDYIKKALADPWKIQIGRPILGRVSDKWVLPICIGLTDYRGRHVGALLASLDINMLSTDLRKVIRETGVDFRIYSTTLNPLTTPPGTDIFSNADKVETQLARIDFSKLPSGVLSQSSLRHPSTPYVFYELSTEFPYVILISYDAKISAQAVNSALFWRLAQILLVACLVIVLHLTIRWRIIRPVEQLGEIVADIARGRKFRAQSKSGPAEIQQLAQQIKKIDDFIEERRRKEVELIQKNRYLMQVKETAQRMSQARLEFLHSLAVELARPVHSIEEDVQAIKDQHFGPLGNARYVEQAEEIYSKSRLLQQMIDDLAAIGEAEYGAVILNEVPVDMSFAIHRAIRHFGEQTQYKHIDIKLRLDEQLPKLLIDEEKLNQILIHMLASSALRAAAGSGFIIETMIDRTPQGENEFVIMVKYTLRASDVNDPPFDTSRLPDLAELTGQMKSDGINLALSRMLLSLHQGRLEVSISHNQVCRVFLRFPQARILGNDGSRA